MHTPGRHDIAPQGARPRRAATKKPREPRVQGVRCRPRTCGWLCATASEDPEALRRLGRLAAVVGVPGAWAERYAERCIAATPSGAPLLWPRRTAGNALRLAYLIAPGGRIEIGGAAIEVESYLR